MRCEICGKPGRRYGGPGRGYGRLVLCEECARICARMVEAALDGEATEEDLIRASYIEPIGKKQS